MRENHESQVGTFFQCFGKGKEICGLHHLCSEASILEDSPALRMLSFMLIRDLYPSRRFALSMQKVLAIQPNLSPSVSLVVHLRPKEMSQTIHSMAIAMVSASLIGIFRICSGFVGCPAAGPIPRTNFQKGIGSSLVTRNASPSTRSLTRTAVEDAFALRNALASRI